MLSPTTLIGHDLRGSAPFGARPDRTSKIEECRCPKAVVSAWTQGGIFPPRPPQRAGSPRALLESALSEGRAPAGASGQPAPRSLGGLPMIQRGCGRHGGIRAGETPLALTHERPVYGTSILQFYHP